MEEIVKIILDFRAKILTIAVPLGALLLVFAGLLFMTKRNTEAWSYIKGIAWGFVIMGVSYPLSEAFAHLVGIK